MQSNASLVASYARAHAAYTLSTKTDGWSLDMEAPVRDAKGAALLTALVKAVSDAVHIALPSAQVTFSSDILGFESTVDQFDLVGISKHVDKLLVMCYEAAKNVSAPEFQKANMPLPMLQSGVATYVERGVPAAKLILAFPWFGFSWKCSATANRTECDPARDPLGRGVHCEMRYAPLLCLLLCVC